MRCRLIRRIIRADRQGGRRFPCQSRMFSRAYEWPLQAKFAESSLAKRLCGRDTPASVDADYHNGIAALRGTHPTGGAMDRQPKAHESFKPASMDAPGLPFQQGEISRAPFPCCRPNLGPHGAFRAPLSQRWTCRLSDTNFADHRLAAAQGRGAHRGRHRAVRIDG
jgi:hypothetical protein